MAECEWAILCDYAFLDVHRKTCLVGVFDRVNTPRVPSVLHQSALALKLLGNPNENVAFKIEVVRPTGGALATFEGSVQLVDTGTAELQFNMAGLPLPDYGAYAFNIHSGNALLKTITFVVAPVPQQQAAGAA